MVYSEIPDTIVPVVSTFNYLEHREEKTAGQVYPTGYTCSPIISFEENVGELPYPPKDRR